MAGFEEDEEGKIGFDPKKAAVGIAIGGAAMKIEGLGQGSRGWLDSITGNPIDTSNLKVGMKLDQAIFDEAGDELPGSPQWIVTEVLENGKFKAIPKNQLDEIVKDQSLTLDEGINSPGLRGISETFDISGKVDTNNPIYRFYEKEIGRYLANKYGAKRIIDPQGVEWWEMPVSKEQGRLPIEAFGLAPLSVFGKKKEEN